MFRVFLGKGINRRKGNVGGRLGGPHLVVARPRGTRAALWCGQPPGPLRVSFGLCVRVGKIGGSVQVSSNSENISILAFLEYKNSRKQELALWHLVNRLVPENA